MKKFYYIFVFLMICFALSAAPRIHDHTIYPALFYNDTRADSAHGFDVLSYDITLTIDDTNHYIEGEVEATVVAEEILTEIVYELEQLDMENVFVNGSPAEFTYNQHAISIVLDSIESGEQFTTKVVYSGYPVLSNDVYHLGIIFNPNYVFTLSDPSGCRWWWPAYDHPWDKAEVDFHVTMRDDWLVACNGIRTGIIDNGDGTKTHHWDGSNPMATFLASISAANYMEIEQSFDDLPIINFVTPGQYDNALVDFDNLPDMIGIYSNRYGEFPFEKYGNSVVPMVTFGAMEHQTMTTLGSYIITGTHYYETVIAHELSHHWFGDCLTPLTWADVWLSEGFAVYSEAIFTQDYYNYDAMLEYVQDNIQDYYLSWSAGVNYTIYDPDFNDYFAPVSYEKAASVLHMLRNRVGSDMFFSILQIYFQEFHNQNVVTADFHAVCEEVSGQDLDQFFDQWIFGSGIPTYEYTWFLNDQSDPPQLKTFVKTASTSGTDYFLSVPVNVTVSDEIFVYQTQSSPDGDFTEIQLNSGDIQSVDVDPEGWILNRGRMEHIPQINNAYAADGQVQIYWSPFWNAVEIQGYNIYRSDEEQGIYIKINDDVITTSNYSDTDVTNGNPYFYKIKAVLDDDFESTFSESVEASPFSFPFDLGILIVDETMDGSGIPGNPNDQQVDDFYNAVISQNVTHYDYDELGAPDLEYLSHYSTLIWHDDDTPQHLINANLEALGSYLLSGGNLIISGWKTANEIDAFFLADFLNCTAEMTSGFEFTSAISNSYPDLQLDEDKISPAFNGTLPFVCVFDDTENGIYQFDAAGGSSHQGEICAIKVNDPVSLMFLGFPLYYFQESQVHDFMDILLDELGESGNSDEMLTPAKMSAFVAPNPFNPNTTIYFTQPRDGFLSLKIHNLKGQLVKTLWNGDKAAGKYSFNWNGRDDAGLPVASGVYYYSLDGNNGSLAGKLILLK